MTKVPDFRIDFDSVGALIGPRSTRILIMPAPSKASSAPPIDIPPSGSSFEDFLDRHQKLIFGFVILLIIGAIAMVIVRGIQKSTREAAGAALVKASDPAAYQAVVTANPATEAAGSAMLLLAEGQWAAGKKDESIATLRKFTSDYPDHAAMPSAKAALGAKLAAVGKSGDAEKILSDLVADPAARYIAPYALVTLGDLSREAGDLDKAATIYNRVKQEYPGSEFGESANQRLATLRTKAPVEIDAPPTPPSPTGTGTGTGTKFDTSDLGIPGLPPMPQQQPAPAPAPPPAPEPTPAPVTPPQDAPPVPVNGAEENPAAAPAPEN